MSTLYRRPFGVGAVLGRWITGAVLVASGISKLMAPSEEFAAIMDAYQLLPIQILMPLSRVLPWVELAVGVCLLLGLFLRWNSIAALALFGVFIAALSWVLARGIDLGGCGCFGKWGPELKPSQTLILDVGFFFLAALVSLDRERFWSVDRWRRKRQRPDL